MVAYRPSRPHPPHRTNIAPTGPPINIDEFTFCKICTDKYIFPGFSGVENDLVDLLTDTHTSLHAANTLLNITIATHPGPTPTWLPYFQSIIENWPNRLNHRSWHCARCTRRAKSPTLNPLLFLQPGIKLGERALGIQGGKRWGVWDWGDMEIVVNKMIGEGEIGYGRVPCGGGEWVSGKEFTKTEEGKVFWKLKNGRKKRALAKRDVRVAEMWLAEFEDKMKTVVGRRKQREKLLEKRKRYEESLKVNRAYLDACEKRDKEEENEER